MNWLAFWLVIGSTFLMCGWAGLIIVAAIYLPKWWDIAVIFVLITVPCAVWVGLQT